MKATMMNYARRGRHHVGGNETHDVEAAVEADFDEEAVHALRHAPRMSVPPEMGGLLRRCVTPRGPHRPLSQANCEQHRAPGLQPQRFAGDAPRLDLSSASHV